MFANQSSKTIPMPGQPDRQVTIRKLSRKSFKRALELMRDGKGRESDEILLGDGVIAWTGEPAKAEGDLSWIDDLSVDGSQALCEAILRFTQPGLLATDEQREEQEKNGSAGSPGTSPDAARSPTTGS